MNVAKFYAKRATDGRAFVHRPRHLDSASWIVRVTAHGRTTYWHCSSHTIDIELLDPSIDVRALRVGRQHQSKDWHREMQKSPGLPMTA